MESGRGNRTTPPITSFDHHVLSEGVADPYASYEDANQNMLFAALSKWAQMETESDGFWLYKAIQIFPV